MKKFLYLLLAGALFSTAAQAKHNGDASMMHGGFYDAEATTMSVADVLGQPDDTFVYMKGQIVKRVGEEEYEFTDGKDKIMLEIDNKIWKGQVVSPKDTVILYGEVDQHGSMKSVDVKSINLIHQ